MHLIRQQQKCLFLCPINIQDTTNELSLTKPSLLSIFLAHASTIHLLYKLEVLYILKATKKRKVTKKIKCCRYCATSTIGTEASIIGSMVHTYSPNSKQLFGLHQEKKNHSIVGSHIGREIKLAEKSCPYLSDSLSCPRTSGYEKTKHILLVTTKQLKWHMLLVPITKHGVPLLIREKNCSSVHFKRGREKTASGSSPQSDQAKARFKKLIRRILARFHKRFTKNRPATNPLPSAMTKKR